MNALATYLKYGVITELASSFMRLNLYISNIKTLPSENLNSIYGLNANEVQYLKNFMLIKFVLRHY